MMDLCSTVHLFFGSHDMHLFTRDRTMVSGQGKLGVARSRGKCNCKASINFAISTEMHSFIYHKQPLIFNYTLSVRRSCPLLLFGRLFRNP